MPEISEPHKDSHKKGGADAFTSSDEIIFALENLAADPLSVKAGRIFYHTGHKGPHIDDGAAIKDLTSAYNAFKTGVAYNSIVAGTWSYLARASGMFNQVWYNSSHALNDEIVYKFVSKAGAFTLVIATVLTADSCIISVYVDGVLQGTIDLYNATTLVGQIKTLSITIVTDGEHSLSLKVTDKNASSTDYYFQLEAWWLRD